MGFEPMGSAFALQCSTIWAVKTHTMASRPISWVHQPVKGMKHRIRWIVNCGNTSEMKMWSSQLYRNLSNCESTCSPEKKRFWDFNGTRTCGLCVSTAVLSQLSYEDPYTGGWPIYWVDQPVKGMKHWIRWIVIIIFSYNYYFLFWGGGGRICETVLHLPHWTRTRVKSVCWYLVTHVDPLSLTSD